MATLRLHASSSSTQVLYRTVIGVVLLLVVSSSQQAASFVMTRHSSSTTKTIFPFFVTRPTRLDKCNDTWRGFLTLTHNDENNSGIYHTSSRSQIFQLQQSTSSYSSMKATTTTVMDGEDHGMNIGAASLLKTALKKASRTLTVSVEYSPSSQLTQVELSVLSMQLRKCKAASIWTSSVEALSEFAEEQQSAKGNFPGPCPIVYFEDSNSSNGISMDRIQEAIAAGATAIVLNADHVSRLDDAALKGGSIEIVWHVSTPEQVEHVLETNNNYAGDAFLVSTNNDEDDTQLTSILQAIPTQGTLVIKCVDAMQEENSEVKMARSLKQSSKQIHSVLVRRACVGDAEDVPYASFVVGGVTSKASSEFQMTGLTGSTNGHFGGVAQRGDTKWRRQETDSRKD